MKSLRFDWVSPEGRVGHIGVVHYHQMIANASLHSTVTKLTYKFTSPFPLFRVSRHCVDASMVSRGGSYGGQQSSAEPNACAGLLYGTVPGGGRRTTARPQGCPHVANLEPLQCEIFCV